MNARILRVPDVCKLIGLSRSTVYRMEERGTFPKRVALTEVAVGWREVDVQAWIDARQPATEQEQAA